MCGKEDRSATVSAGLVSVTHNYWIVKFTVIFSVLQAIGNGRPEKADLLEGNAQALISTGAILKRVYEARAHRA